MLKTASLVSLLAGIMFGIPCLYGIWNLWKGKGIAYVFGFPSYGNGPFEKIGVHSNIPLLLGFLLVCALECVAGKMLWSADKGGAILSLVIIPAELAYYIGFALPFGPPLLIIRTLLLIFSWSAFHHA